jgi:hypothetical protein
MARNPWKVDEGISSQSYLLSPLEQIQKLPLPVRSVQSLHELTKGFVFFSPASLYLRKLIGGDQPWVDFCREFRCQTPIYHHRFQCRLFRNLITREGDNAWNSVLWAIPQHVWFHFKAYLGSLTFIRDDLNAIDTVIVQEVMMLDPVLRELGIDASGAPRIPVYFVGITGTVGTCCVVKEEHNELIVAWGGPSPNADKMRANILEGKPPLMELS